jgi:hypothetical protein
VIAMSTRAKETALSTGLRGCPICGGRWELTRQYFRRCVGCGYEPRLKGQLECHELPKVAVSGGYRTLAVGIQEDFAAY